MRGSLHWARASCWRTILCRAMPRSTAGFGLSRDMLSYMAASISQKAMVLSPTRACRDTQYAHQSAI